VELLGGAGGAAFSSAARRSRSRMMTKCHWSPGSWASSRRMFSPPRLSYLPPHLSGEILPNIIKLALNSRIMAHFPSETVIFNR
jgi:hypothetical protein